MMIVSLLWHSVYGRGGKLDKAIDMFNTAQSMGFSMDEKTYTNMISYYGKAGKVFSYFPCVLGNQVFFSYIIFLTSYDLSVS